MVHRKQCNRGGCCTSIGQGTLCAAATSWCCSAKPESSTRGQDQGDSLRFVWGATDKSLVQLQVVEEQLGTQRTRLLLSTQPAASLSSKRKRGHPKHEGQVIRNEIKRLEQLMVKLRSRKTSCLCQVPADVADEYQSGAMVGCDGRCAGWYHPQCIGYTKKGCS